MLYGYFIPGVGPVYQSVPMTEYAEPWEYKRVKIYKPTELKVEELTVMKFSHSEDELVYFNRLRADAGLPPFAPNLNPKNRRRK